jgi:hypothetical protein
MFRFVFGVGRLFGKSGEANNYHGFFALKCFDVFNKTQQLNQRPQQCCD